MIYKVIFENKLQRSITRQEFFSPLSAFFSLTVRTWFNASSSYVITFFTTSFVCKVINTLQNKIAVKEVLVEELEALK